MSTEPTPEHLAVPLAALVGLGVEHWRLSTWLASVSPAGGGGGATAPARHALRRIEDLLKLCELEVRTMDGRPFDAGLAVRVVDTVDDASLPAGAAVIAETLAPMVLWRGRVVKEADVVTRRGPAAG